MVAAALGSDQTAALPMSDTVNLSPRRVAPLIAPVIDRVVIGILLRVLPHGRRLAEAHGLSRSGGLVEFRYALLAGPVERTTAEAVARYFSPGGLDEELDAQVEQGMIVVDAAGRISLTDAGRSFVTAIYDLHAEMTAEAWEGQADDVDRLCTLVGRVLAEGQATAGPAFAGMSAVYERAGDPPALVLFNRLSALRYHRADAHAAAWAAAGHTAESIRAMAPGPARQSIEDDTNRRAAAPYVALTADERLDLLAGLAALP
jgi:hypothetical protein